MSGPGSGGNVLAALASFFIPGLGQLLQGRVIMASILFVAWVVSWILSLVLIGIPFLIGFWILAVLDAALYRG
jgi:hypothetical protein